MRSGWWARLGLNQRPLRCQRRGEAVSSISGRLPRLTQGPVRPSKSRVTHFPGMGHVSRRSADEQADRNAHRESGDPDELTEQDRHGGPPVAGSICATEHVAYLPECAPAHIARDEKHTFGSSTDRQNEQRRQWRQCAPLCGRTRKALAAEASFVQDRCAFIGRHFHPPLAPIRFSRRGAFSRGQLRRIPLYTGKNWRKLDLQLPSRCADIRGC